MGCDRFCVPGGLVHMYDVDITGTFYNHVLVQDPNAFALEKTEAEFTKRRIPFTVKIPKQRAYSELENSLQARGYILVPVWSLMTFDAVPARQRNPGVRVERVNTFGLAEWLTVSTTGNLPSNHTITQQNMVKRASEKKSIHLLLAKLNNKPVGRGLLYLKNKVASIHMMTTIPEFRRKHVATTIVLEALDRLKEERTNLTWLRTRKGGTGEKVYLRIGFKPILDILTYTLNPHLDQAVATA